MTQSIILVSVVLAIEIVFWTWWKRTDPKNVKPKLRHLRFL